MTQRPSEFRVFDRVTDDVYVSVSRNHTTVDLTINDAADEITIGLDPGIANEFAKAVLQASQAAEAQQ